MTWAEQVLAGGNLCAPELAKVEAMNIIYRLECAKQIATVEANLDVHALSQLEIELFAFEPFARWVWELRHAVTCYDAWYVGRRRSCGLAARNAGPSSVPRQRPYLQIPGAPVTKQSGAWKTILKSYAPRYRLASH